MCGVQMHNVGSIYIVMAYAYALCAAESVYFFYFPRLLEARGLATNFEHCLLRTCIDNSLYINVM